MHRNAGGEAQWIVGHGHGEGEQLLVRFFGRPKPLNLDTAGRQMHARGKRIEFLVDDGGGGFHENAGLPGLGMQLVENGA